MYCVLGKGNVSSPVSYSHNAFPLLIKVTMDNVCFETALVPTLGSSTNW